VIGWIPYQPLRGSQRPVTYARHQYATALRLVLLTGNRPEPPSQLLNRATYDRFIKTKNFRAALCLSNVTLTCYSDGRDADIRAKPGDFIGYTPYKTKGPFGWFKRELAWHHLGIGEIDGDVEKYPDHATIRRHAKFRLAKLENLGSKLFTNHWAPYAWMSIAYTMWRNGNVRVEYCGSLIPSQSIYARWDRRRRHSMLTLSSSQISSFLEAGGDVLAPGALHHTWIFP
jgi:hypothetical protein